MLEKYLEEIGLSDKEAVIYLALLQVENAAISDIAKKSGINRTTVYPVLESLEKKGLASEVQVGKTTHFQAEPPERLETFVERQKVVLEERAARLKDIIPQIKNVERDAGERPVIKFFEGRDGAISAYREFYALHDDSTREGYFIFNRDLLREIFTDKERLEFKKIRIGKNVSPISIYTDKSGPHSFISDGKRVHLDQDSFPLTCDISIIDDRIIVTTLGQRVTAILIRSKDFADTLKSIVKAVHK